MRTVVGVRWVGGRKGKGGGVVHTDLNDEAGRVPGVLVIHDAAGIANDLTDAAKDHGGHEAPFLVSNTEEDLSDHA